MKRLLLIAFALISVCKAQKSFFSATFQFEQPKGSSAFGGRLTGGVNVKNNLLAGFGVGVTKVQNTTGVIIPIFAHIQLTDLNKKLAPSIIIEPGYGAYNNETRSGMARIETKGGFTFYGGAGVTFRGGAKSAGFFNVGYSVYTLESLFVTQRIKGLAIRLGIIGL